MTKRRSIQTRNSIPVNPVTNEDDPVGAEGASENAPAREASKSSDRVTEDHVSS